VLLIHGVETADPGYGDRASTLLRRAFAKYAGVRPEEALVVRPAYWAPVLQAAEDDLFRRCFGPGQARYVRWLQRQARHVDHGSRLAMLALSSSALLPRVPFAGPLPWPTLRWVTTAFAGDAIAYQIAGQRDHTVYDAIHARIAAALRDLAATAGPDAPLCVLGHSLGSVIASNFFYDLQVEYGHYPRGGPLGLVATATGPGRVPPQPLGAPGEPPASRDLIPAGTRLAMGRAPSPLERGETLTDLITLGSPLALYSLRSRGFHRPLLVPAPTASAGLGPARGAGEARRRGATDRPAAGGWLNVYSPYDLVSQPLRPLSEEYRLAVREDVRLAVGPWWAARGPLSHVWYWYDARVADLAGRALAHTWRAQTSAASKPIAPRAAAGTPVAPRSAVPKATATRTAAAKASRPKPATPRPAAATKSAPTASAGTTRSATTRSAGTGSAGTRSAGTQPAAAKPAGTRSAGRKPVAAKPAATKATAAKSTVNGFTTIKSGGTKAAATGAGATGDGAIA
jgi:hypothetical protein